MPVVDLNQLVKRLDGDARMALEAAAANAVRSAHETIELAHWLHGMASVRAFRELIEAIGVSAATFEGQTAKAVGDMRRGAGGTPSFSTTVITLAREAWVGASLQHGRRLIHPGDLLGVLIGDPSLRSLARSIAPALHDANAAALEAQVAGLAPERDGADAGSAVSSVLPGSAPAGGEDFLAAYTQDMTADAREGRIDRVVGRDAELRQVIDILLRRRQNNPILVGEAGVGKTAIAEAFALQIAAGDVPDKLRGVRLLSLDLSLLQAGAGVKGEFERRLRGVVDSVKASPAPIILFIDEAHTLIGAGGPAGQGDAANILKPSLARGELRTIAATTWSEFKRYVERDPALTRRFQMVKVDEPDEDTAVRMLRGLADAFQTHHGVRIRDDALRAAVRLSQRYIPARQLPDKAVSLIDTAAASVAFGRQVEPAELADVKREAALLGVERERLSAEPETLAIMERIEAIDARVSGLGRDAEALEARLAKERALIDEADGLEDGLSGEGAGANRRKLATVEDRLATLQGEAPLVHRVVDEDAIAGLVARWTGVPVGRLVSDQISAVTTLGARLKERVVGQDHALDALASAMRVARAGLADPRRPPGVFLMVGMSGVGKTETALAIADVLYGGAQHLTVINMSEFKEEHKVSMLVGSPPGYVGYGEGGVLTEAVRRRPYGVLLLDEIDKAHPGVQDVFYQLFDKGSLRDGEGRDVDFKNTTILMTANSGSEVLAALAADPETMPAGDSLGAVLKDALRAQFKPAFLGRTTVLPYLPLDRDAFAGIVEIQVGRIVDRVRATYGCALTLSPAAKARLIDGAELGDAGARAIEAMLSRDLLPRLATYFLESLARGHKDKSLEIDLFEGEFQLRPADAVADPEFAKAVPAANGPAPRKRKPSSSPDRGLVGADERPLSN